jgi:hypothetical protein
VLLKPALYIESIIKVYFKKRLEVLCRDVIRKQQLRSLYNTFKVISILLLSSVIETHSSNAFTDISSLAEI